MTSSTYTYTCRSTRPFASIWLYLQTAVAILPSHVIEIDDNVDYFRNNITQLVTCIGGI